MIIIFGCCEQTSFKILNIFLGLYQVSLNDDSLYDWIIEILK